MAEISIEPHNIENSLKFCDEIIQEHGARLAGSKACFDAANTLFHKFADECDEAQIESFRVRPKSFLGFMRAAVIIYLFSVIFLYYDYVLIAALGFFVGIFMILSQFMFYWRVFDPFFKQRTGYNVWGKIEPDGKIYRQIIISGHHDSAFEFRYLTKMPKLYPIRVAGALLSVTLALIATWYWEIYKIFTGTSPPAAEVIRYGTLGLLVFIIPMYFFIKNKGTPGAGDNLISSTIATELASIYSSKKRQGQNPLKHTRLWFVSFDAEEAGLRGSRAFVRAHIDELHNIPTYVLNMDSLYDPNELRVVTGDLNATVRLSDKLAEELIEIATKLGWKLIPFILPPGGGATDAAEFAKRRIQATSIIGMSPEFYEGGAPYHTQNDTVEAIDPEVVRAVMQIVNEFILIKDSLI